MTTLRKSEHSALLSRYLDNEVTDLERANVETLLRTNDAAAAELRELARMKELLAGRQALQPHLGFYSRLTVALEERTREEENLLPISRKYFPAALGMSSVVLAVLGFLFFQKRDLVGRFVGEQSQAVKDVVENNVIKSSILPLFASVDRDQALQFALFGSVPIDDKSAATLKVDDRAGQGYRIEVTASSGQKQHPVTVKDFIAEVHPSRTQQESIDSILDMTRRRIQSSILVGDGDLLAVDPDLPKLNRVLVGNIAAHLSRDQQGRFERLLRLHNAPTVVQLAKHLGAEQIAANRRTMNIPRPEKFMVITPETLVFANIGFDGELLAKQIEVHEGMRQELFARRDRFIARALQAASVSEGNSEPMEVGSMPELFRVDVLPKITGIRTGQDRPAQAPPDRHPNRGYAYQVQIGGEGSDMVQIHVFNPSMVRMELSDPKDSNDLGLQVAARERLRARRAKLDSLVRALQQ